MVDRVGIAVLVWDNHVRRKTWPATWFLYLAPQKGADRTHIVLRELFERVLGSASRRRESRSAFVEAPINAQAEESQIAQAAVRQRYIERRGFIIADLITAYLPESERFTILDGGAREAFADPRWQVFDPKRMRLHGFEPDEKEVRELNTLASQRGLDYRYHCGALWSEPSEQAFHENKSPGGGSFFLQKR